MTLTARQIELVQSTWGFVTLNVAEAGMIFYDRLFTLDPSLRSMFKGDIKQQSNRLMEMISYAIKKLHSISEIVPEVQALGKRHTKYNVKPNDYNTVSEALLWTLEKGLAEKWTDETKQSWIAVYTLLSETMINAEKN